MNGAFLCFDLTNKQTFENLPYWVKQIKQHANENIAMILLGNKNDDKMNIQVVKYEGFYSLL